MNLFSFNSWLSRFLYLVADIVILHVLFIVCSLPIITIGASTTALYYAGMKRVRRDESYLSKNFIYAFKENFRQSTLIWLILILVWGLLLLDLRIGMSVPGVLGNAMLISCSVLLIPVAFIALYIFPFEAKFENSIRENFKNAFLMSFSNFVWTILLIILIGTFVIMTFTFIPFMGLMIMCGFGLFGYLASGIFVYIFRKYIPNELEEDAEVMGMTSDDRNPQDGKLF